MDIYQDQIITMDTPSSAATKGHIHILSTVAQAIEQSSEADFAHVFSAASFASRALFEQAGAHGTNILIDDLHKTVQAHILARTEEDGISFQWKTKEYAQGEMDSYYGRIKDKCDYINEKKQQKERDKTTTRKDPAKEASAQQEEKKGGQHMQKEKNYLIEQLNRLP